MNIITVLDPDFSKLVELTQIICSDYTVFKFHTNKTDYH